MSKELKRGAHVRCSALVRCLVWILCGILRRLDANLQISRADIQYRRWDTTLTNGLWKGTPACSSGGHLSHAQKQSHNQLLASCCCGDAPMTPN